MKPTTQSKSRPETGAIPTEHDPLAAAEFDSWIERQLEHLEANFAEFTTVNSTFADIASQRT